MKVHQYNEDTDEWEYYTEQDGVICQYIEQFLSKAWDKAKINANPEIKETCGLLKVSFIDFSLILICTYNLTLLVKNIFNTVRSITTPL
jgi:hypothetical protein